MASDLSLLLHKFLDLYKRDPDALHRHFNDPILVDSEDIPPIEQLGLIRGSERAAQERIRRNTLINTSGPAERHALLQHALGDSREHAGNTASDENLQRLLARAKSEPNPDPESFADNAREWQEQEDLAVELLRYFADRIDSIVGAIEGLDESDFQRCVPESLDAPFRELHINAILGNYGTVAILCGAVLEQSLQDLLPTDETLNRAINEAKRCKLLVDYAIIDAIKIRDARNDIVHGKVRFDALTPNATWELVAKTRGLIRGLYQARMEEEN